ncbi:hypothetical protein GCM10008960_33160 [Deinococcus sedimenti]|uniref:Uncharacterized protein n=1 Tax=Deinococcus sedimenti TaxID=1867090 RepID=A0ABQ2SA54_9DEIO|nr:hypothetical protein GCM10008960_33160 [Deinococcus sedimenti]
MLTALVLGPAEAGGGGAPTPPPFVLTFRLDESAWTGEQRRPWTVPGTTVQAHVSGKGDDQSSGTPVGVAVAVKNSLVQLTLPARLDERLLTPLPDLPLFAARCGTDTYSLSDPQARVARADLVATYRKEGEIRSVELTHWLEERTSGSTSIAEYSESAVSVLIYADRPVTLKYRDACESSREQPEFWYTSSSQYNLDLHLRRGWNMVEVNVYASSARDYDRKILTIRDSSLKGYWTP